MDYMYASCKIKTLSKNVLMQKMIKFDILTTAIDSLFISENRYKTANKIWKFLCSPTFRSRVKVPTVLYRGLCQADFLTEKRRRSYAKLTISKFCTGRWLISSGIAVCIAFIHYPKYVSCLPEIYFLYLHFFQLHNNYKQILNTRCCQVCIQLCVLVCSIDRGLCIRPLFRVLCADDVFVLYNILEWYSFCDKHYNNKRNKLEN